MRKKPGYNEQRERSFLRALGHAYRTTGAMVSFQQPEPEQYKHRYLALRLEGTGYMDWKSLKTDNLREAQASIQECKRWYIHDLDNGTFTSDKTEEWLEQGAFSRGLAALDD